MAQKKRVMVGPSAQEKLKSGVQTVAKLLRPAMKGVDAYAIVIEDGRAVATKNPYLLLKSCHELTDPFENIGAQMVRAHDPLTIQFAAALLELEQIEIATALPLVLKRLEAMARPLERGEERGEFIVALLECEYDAELVRAVKEAFEVAGQESAIAVEGVERDCIQVECIEGMQIEARLASPYFMNDPSSAVAVLKQPYLIAVDATVEEKDALLYMKKALDRHAPLLVIAPLFSAVALNIFITNHLNQRLSMAAAIALPRHFVFEGVIEKAAVGLECTHLLGARSQKEEPKRIVIKVPFAQVKLMNSALAKVQAALIGGSLSGSALLVASASTALALPFERLFHKRGVLAESLDSYSQLRTALTQAAAIATNIFSTATLVAPSESRSV